MFNDQIWTIYQQNITLLKNCFSKLISCSRILGQKVYPGKRHIPGYPNIASTPQEGRGGGGLVELNYNNLIKFRYMQRRPALFRNLQSFVDCSIERSVRYMFLIDLESNQHKLSSDYSLNIYFSHRFPYIDSPSFSPYKPL